MFNRLYNLFGGQHQQEEKAESIELTTFMKWDNGQHSIPLSIYRGKGQEWVHFVFSNKDDAEIAGLKLFELRLVEKTPNVNKAVQGHQNYPQGSYFFRVYPTAYPKIAAQFQFESIESLVVYSKRPAQ